MPLAQLQHTFRAQRYGRLVITSLNNPEQSTFQWPQAENNDPPGSPRLCRICPLWYSIKFHPSTQARDELYDPRTCLPAQGI